ncbi:MAG: SDR family oxidoreductase [Eubacterium sp.]|nr:SDR family oxidoreductase [Eubacterium sp.]
MKRSILITGASSGIGKAVSKYLSEQGCFVIIVARNRDKLSQVADQLCGQSLVIPYNLLDLEHIEDIFVQCSEKGIKLDGLVHCAGINCDIPVRMNEVKVMQDVTTVNYYSFVELGKYFGKRKYSNERASVVAISAMAADVCQKGMCTYSASKAALNAAVRVMGREFVKRHQRVNAIMPAFVNTPMVERMDSALGDLERKIEAQPLGLIEPEQIAYLVDFLLSDKSSYITGACIPVSAGAM